MTSDPSSASSDQGPELRYVPETSDRPVGVTVFAILNILFGIAGLGSLAFSMIFMYVSEHVDLGPNPVLDLLQEDKTYRIFNAVAGVVGAIFAVVLLVSGIGLLKMRPWARILAIVYAFYAIIGAVIGNIFNYIYIYKPMLTEAAGGGPGGEEIAMLGGIIGGVVGGCFALVLPVAILIYFFRPTIRAEFQKES